MLTQACFPAALAALSSKANVETAALTPTHGREALEPRLFLLASSGARLVRRA